MPLIWRPGDIFINKDKFCDIFIDLGEKLESISRFFPQSAFSKNVEVILPRPNKKILRFRVTRPYLNLLVKQKKKK